MYERLHQYQLRVLGPLAREGEVEEEEALNEPEPSVQESSASGRGRGHTQATTTTPVDVIAQEVTRALQAAFLQL